MAMDINVGQQGCAIRLELKAVSSITDKLCKSNDNIDETYILLNELVGILYKLKGGDIVKEDCDEEPCGIPFNDMSVLDKMEHILRGQLNLNLRLEGLIYELSEII